MLCSADQGVGEPVSTGCKEPGANGIASLFLIKPNSHVWIAHTRGFAGPVRCPGMPLVVRNWRGDAVFAPAHRVPGVLPARRSLTAAVWKIIVAFIVEHRVLQLPQRRRLGDLCRAAHRAHVSRWSPRVISYPTWLRLGGGILPALERRAGEHDKQVDDQP